MSLLVFKTDCEFPRWTAAVFLPQNLFMLVLFLDFYIKTYVKKPKAVASKEDTSSSNKHDREPKNGIRTDAYKNRNISENAQESTNLENGIKSAAINKQITGNGKQKAH